jgi:hypothetical protein
VSVIISDVDRETATVPQVIEIVAAGGRYWIEGHHLKDLMARLNDQNIANILAYCPRHWQDSRPAKGDPVVTARIRKGQVLAPIPRRARRSSSRAP